MRILIDLQGAQVALSQGEPAPDALLLTKALLRQPSAHEFVLLCNGLFAATLEPLRTALAPGLPEQNFRVWTALEPLAAQQLDNAARRSAAQALYAAYAAALEPDLLLHTSPLEGWDNPALGLPAQPLASLTVVLFLEPNPFITRSSLLANPAQQAWHQQQALSLQRADLLLTTSPAATQVAQAVFACLPERIFELQLQPSPAVFALPLMQRLELLHHQRAAQSASLVALQEPVQRPRLAFVSPLPPARSGIADYSAELLRALTRWYEVELIIDQATIADDWLLQHCTVRDPAGLRAHPQRYERVLYHIGNSHFHQHVFGLLADIPGVVVLHDFFLSHALAASEPETVAPGAWAQALHHSHGYCALQARYQADAGAAALWDYPCNLAPLQQALGVIVHSAHACSLARQWYGPVAATDWHVIPLLRAPAHGSDRVAARQALGLQPHDFLICAFGHTGPTKLNQLLLDAFAHSDLATDSSVQLVFVGQNSTCDYGQQLQANIRASGLGQRLRISGWVDSATYQRYLQAADLAVQLRTQSRGETSAAVLDCLNHGLPTIANAHGSLAELDPAALCLLPDACSAAELAQALLELRLNPQRCTQLGQRGQALVHEQHAPAACAARYATAIERCYRRQQAGALGLLQAWASHPPAGIETVTLARLLAQHFPPAPHLRQLLVDVSALVQVDLGTGIQRVVRAVLQQWLSKPVPGWRIEPIYTTPGAPGYRYARQFSARFLGLPPDSVGNDEAIDAWSGDLYLSLDLVPWALAQHAQQLTTLRERGVGIAFVVYDLLPLQRPDCFPPDTTQSFGTWMQHITRLADSLLCISRATLDDQRHWLDAHPPARQRPLRLAYFHLGADIAHSTPSSGLPQQVAALLNQLRRCPSFLMVATVEPRKGHAQTLNAFELLWQSGLEANLVIVGKQGWMVETLCKRLRSHPEAGRRLHWLQGISDEYLEQVYAACTCLIAASEGEGFGLPLIEAARHGLPILARDLPVFREVAGAHAYYFSGLESERLAQAIQNWMVLHAQGQAPQSGNLPRLTWAQSAQTLQALLLDPQHPHWLHTWQPVAAAQPGTTPTHP